MDKFLTQKQITKKVDTWLETNDFADFLYKNEGFYKLKQNYGRVNVVEIHAVTGKIGTREEIPNSWSPVQNEYIDLLRVQQYAEDEANLCDYVQDCFVATKKELEKLNIIDDSEVVYDAKSNNYAVFFGAMFDDLDDNIEEWCFYCSRDYSDIKKIAALDIIRLTDETNNYYDNISEFYYDLKERANENES